MSNRLTPWHATLILTSLLGILFLTNISLGSVPIPIQESIPILFGSHASPDLFANIIWQFRLPKAITCIVAGAALSTGGLLMQTLFRNPLAGPDVLGLSSGASLIVAIVLLIGQSAPYLPQANPWVLAAAASIGSSLVFLLVMVVAHTLRDNISLLIVGLMIAAVTGSLVSMLQFFSNAQDLQAFTIWTLGSVGGTSWEEIYVLSFVLLMGGGMALLSMKSINAWLLGDHYALSLGVNLKRSRLKIVLATGIMTGGVTAFCGPIAFVGLAVPHLVRLLTPTANHKVLIPMVMFGGAALLLFCDILAQLPGTARVLPLNAVTSILGAPVVIWVVMRSKGPKM